MPAAAAAVAKPARDSNQPIFKPVFDKAQQARAKNVIAAISFLGGSSLRQRIVLHLGCVGSAQLQDIADALNVTGPAAHMAVRDMSRGRAVKGKPLPPTYPGFLHVRRPPGGSYVHVCLTPQSADVAFALIGEGSYYLGG